MTGTLLTNRKFSLSVSVLAAVLCVLLFLALNGLDYKNLGDVFRHGKIRYLSLFLAPVAFHYLRPKLTWGPAFFGSLAIFSWAIHDYMMYAGFPLLLILGVLVAACFVVDMGEEALARILILSGVLQSSLALLQYFGFYFLFHPASPKDFNIPVGFMGNETVLGSFLVAAICPALWRKNYIAAALMIAAIIVSYSQMAWGALGVVLVLFLWHKVNLRAALASVLAGIVTLSGCYFFFSDSPAMSFHGRLFIWPFGLRAIMEAPLFGSGIGSWVGVYVPRFKDEILAQFNHHLPYQLHNDYLDFIVEYGLAAFGVLSVALSQFIFSFKPTWVHAVCVAILVNSLANFPLCLIPTALIFVVCWAHANRRGAAHA